MWLLFVALDRVSKVCRVMLANHSRGTRPRETVDSARSMPAGLILRVGSEAGGTFRESNVKFEVACCPGLRDSTMDKCLHLPDGV